MRYAGLPDMTDPDVASLIRATCRRRTMIDGYRFAPPILRATLLRRLPHIPCRRRPHRHQLFRSRRMQRDRRVEIGLGRFHLYGDRDCLDDFGGGVADDVTAEYAIRG